MRLSGLLQLSGVSKVRFDNWRRHELLPFYSGLSDGDARLEAEAASRRNVKYSAADAFKLRLMADLVMSETSDGYQLFGLTPPAAKTLISNAMGYAIGRQFETLGAFVGAPLYLGGLIVETDHDDPDFRRFSRWFAGPLEEFAAWVAQTGRDENGRPIRLASVNARTAALYVLSQADDLGLDVDALMKEQV